MSAFDYDAVLAKIEAGDIDTVRRIARLFLDATEYLDEHDTAGGAESELQMPCTRKGYHSCSLLTTHATWCVAGEPVPEGERGRPCPPGCVGVPAPWCHSVGFDCPDCALVRELMAIAL